ncbi:MAG: Ku protein [Alphaproteobacteria bacterium]
MAPRASWKGYMKLSLVSCPVRLYNATTRSDRISFHWLHKDTHNRVQMKPHDPELGEVERSDLVKGYEFEKDRYVVITDEDLEDVQIESTKTISIEHFVDEVQIDPMYFESSYYIAPDGPVAEETYRVLHEAMRQRNKAALARVVLSNKERLVLLTIRDKGFLLTTLRAANEVRQPAPYFEDITNDKIDKEMLKLAELLIDQNEGEFDATTFEDGYQKALLELVKAKIKGSRPVVAKAPERGKVINLMDALKRSLEEADSKKPPAASKRRAAAAGRSKVRGRRKAAAG